MSSGAPRAAALAFGALLALVAALPAAASAASDPPPTTLWRAFPLDPRNPAATGPVAPATPRATTTARLPAPASGRSGHRTLWLLVAAGLALLAVALIAIVLPRRRSRATAPAPAGPEPARPAPAGERELAAVAPARAGARAPAAPAPRVPSPPPPPARAPRVQTCTIRWRPDPERCWFAAESDDDEGGTIDRSATFRWRSQNPPPRRAVIVEAHAGLVGRLTASGWSLLAEEPPPAGGRAPRWYERRLSRTAPG